MAHRVLWRFIGAFLLVAALAVGAVGSVGLPAFTDAPAALAAVAADHKNESDDNDDDNDDEDEDQERDLSGQVVSPSPGVPGINLGVSPPEMYVATLDGIVTVKVIRPEALNESGVREGDHVGLDGERITDVLFEASDIDVKDRCCTPYRVGNDDHVGDPGQGEDDDDGDDDD